MAVSSHGRCKVCRRVIHRGAKFGMCAQHSRRQNRILAQERQRIKASRRARRDAPHSPTTDQLVLEEEPDMTETPDPQPVPEPERRKPGPKPGPPRDRLAGMSDETKLMIAGHYANYDIPVDKIVSYYHIANGDVTRIADELGVERRDRRNVGRALPPGRFIADQWVVEPEPAAVESATPHSEPDIPEDTAKALENMLKLPSQPEPPVRRSLEQIIDSIPHAFQAHVEGLFTIEGEDMLDALSKLKAANPQLRVTQIRELY